MNSRWLRLTVLVISAGTLALAAAEATAEPSNTFTFGKLKRDTRLGTAQLPVILPGPGYLRMRGKGLVPSTGGAVVGPGTSAPNVSEFIKARGPKKRMLNQTGKVRLLAKVTYTPLSGTAHTQSRRVTLIKRR